MLVVEGLIVGFVFLCKYELGFETHDMFVLGFFMIAIAGVTAVLSKGVKFLWSRPHPRYIYTFDNPENYFHAVGH